MTGWVIAAALLALAGLTALAAGLAMRRRAARTLGRVEQMLAAAMEGRFSEEHFDESRLSALEARLARYLTASEASAGRVRQEKDRLVGLVADIAHQTRTPVANLRLYSQLLAEQPLSPAGRDCAAAIDAQSEKLGVLVEALVKTSRLETGLLALHPAPGPLEPLLHRAAAQYAPAAAEKGVALTVSEAAGEAVFDEKWTEEALCNLLDNAVKYTPAGGAVTVEARLYEMFAAIRVADTGPGIPESEHAKIFGRFYRCPGAYQAQGVGIGLYLARQIAQGQGGYLKVESAPGRGSVFSLWLPRR
ncbi:MAG TPA: HAMP domain-containing histidine kinase [Candidatus Fournierella excrementigallinarum]|nr:HAMP domain-containing histidine kinase [Candidatus Fournierella excrementigallinarum]